MEGNCCGHLGFLINTVLAHFDPEIRNHPVATEQVSAQGDKRFRRDVENCFSY